MSLYHNFEGKQPPVVNAPKLASRPSSTDTVDMMAFSTRRSQAKLRESGNTRAQLTYELGDEEGSIIVVCFTDYAKSSDVGTEAVANSNKDYTPDALEVVKLIESAL